MATHSSILAWRIPWRKEPGRLQSTGWQGVGHDWATFSFFLSFLLYRNKRFNLPAPENVSGRQLWTLSPFWVFSAGESYYWGHKVLFFFFPVSRLFTSCGQSIGASASVLPMNIQGWFPLGLTGLISLLPKRCSRVFSSTTLWSSILQCSAFFMVQLSHLYMTTRTKKHSFD